MSSSFDRLEPRRHFAAQTLASIDGLPRELAAVGDTVYFARDSGVDGHLSYPELASYNVKTGKRGSVTRGDGKPFGALKYTLATDGGRLLITESDGRSHRELWAVDPGSSRAWKAADGFGADASNTARVGATTYVRMSQSVYAIHRPGTAARVLDAKKIDKNRSFTNVLSWNGQLVVTMMRPASGAVDRIYLSDGTAAGTRELSVPVPKGTDRFGSVRVIGSNLVVTTDGSSGGPGRVYYSGNAKRGFGEFKRASGLRITDIRGAAGNQLILTASDGSFGSHTIATDFTTRGTRQFANGYESIGGHMFAIGSEIYTTGYLADKPYDPESVGGYVAPGNFSSGTISIGGSVTGPTPGVFHLNFTTGKVERILEVTSARDFVTVGDRGYFMGRAAQPSYSYSYGSSPSTDPKADLYVTDGTAGGTIRVSSVFSGPVVAAGKVIYTSTFDDDALRTPDVSTGMITGTVSRSDVSGSSSSSSDQSFRVAGMTVFLDLDRDGLRDSNEPKAIVDQNAIYRFENVEPRSQPYAVAIERFGKWSATDGWSQDARVRAGRTLHRSFRFEDRRDSALVSGRMIHRGSESLPVVNQRMLVYGGDSTLITSFKTDSRGRFRVGGLSAGTYSFRGESSDFLFFVVGQRGTMFTIGVGQELDLSRQ